MDSCRKTVESYQLQVEDRGMCRLVSRQWERKARNVLGITSLKYVHTVIACLYSDCLVNFCSKLQPQNVEMERHYLFYCRFSSKERDSFSSQLMDGWADLFKEWGLWNHSVMAVWLCNYDHDPALPVSLTQSTSPCCTWSVRPMFGF